jgi:hypothetical protein
MLGLAGTAGAIDWQVATHPQPIDKDSYVGDGMGDTREGGEDFGSAVVIGSLPYSDSGATCDNVDNIGPINCSSAGGAPDVFYVYTAPVTQCVNFDMCGSGYDTTIMIYQGGVEVGCNDDSCGLQSQILGFTLTGGLTYYIIVDGFSAGCGSYVLNITECAGPCTLTCPPGAWLEGEPDCADGYFDTYNGGCNSTGWTPICPQVGDTAVMCGKMGTYFYQGLSYRDTDWYDVRACGGPVTVTWTGEADIQGFIIFGPNLNCGNYQLNPVTGTACVPASLTQNFGPCEIFWVWAGTTVFGSGVPCGTDYIIEISGICDCDLCIPDPTETQSWGAIKNLYR